MHRFIKWRDALSVASDVRAVKALMRDYAACIAPEEVAKLPPECRRVLVDPDPDIQYAGVTMLHAEMGYQGDPAVAALLHEIAHTYAAAAVRVGQLFGRAETPAPKD